MVLSGPGCEAKLADWHQERDPYSLKVIEAGAQLMHPRQMPRELERAMLSTDLGNIDSASNSCLRFERPPSMFAAMSFGNCGYAFPCIIGAKLATPSAAPRSPSRCGCSRSARRSSGAGTRPRLPCKNNARASSAS